MGVFQYLVGFAAGLYAGVYLGQSYELPKLEEPSAIVDKVKEYLSEHKKDD